MGTFSIWHWFIVLVVVVLFIGVPIWLCWRICTRAGYSGAWALTYFIPFVGLIMIWVFAFSRWPILKNREQAIAETFE